MKVKVYNQAGQETGEIMELNPRIFTVEKIKPEVVHFVATALKANAHRARAATKTRGQVRGGGRKPWKQKGTGRARVGSIRSPLWRGGGITFGPTPLVNFHQKVNRRVRRLGIFSAFSDRMAAQRLIILDKLELPEGKTKELIAKLKNLETLTNGKKYLIVIPERDQKLNRAARNLADVTVRQANNINVLDLLNAESLIILKNALPILEQTYLK